MKFYYKLYISFSLALFLSAGAANIVFSQPANWTNIGPGAGGAFYNPQISPFNPNEIFFPSDMSDLFHTTDLGNTFKIINFQYITSGGSSLVQFTSDPKILYTIDNNEFGMFPKKSPDAGVTWSKLNSDPTSGGSYQLFASDLVSNKVIITDYSNVYYTNDGGNNFSKIFAGNSGTWGSYIAGIFWDTNDTYIVQPDGLLISKNGGAFVSEKPSGLGAGEYIISACAGKVGGVLRIYAVTLNECWPGITGADHPAYKAVYTLDYGASSWIKKTNGLLTTAHPFFAAMGKENIDVAYLAGAETSNSSPAVFKTIDGGNTWVNTFISKGNLNIKTGWSGEGGDRNWSYGEYALGFTVSRTNPDYQVITDLGFAHVTSDGGKIWNQIYVNKADENKENTQIPKGKAYHSIGLENTSCWQLCWSDNNNVFGCYTDIQGARSTNGGDSWSFDYTGHSDNTMYYCMKHSMNLNLYAATSSVHDLYESTYLADSKIDGGRGKVLTSTNNGKTWTIVKDFAHPVIWLATDPKNANTMYASVVHSSLGGIFRCDNITGGGTWTQCAVPTRTQGHPYNVVVLNDGTVLCTYSGRRDTKGAFISSSGIFMSTDKGASWTDKSDPNMQYWTKDIIIDPNDQTQNTWYVGVFSGWGGAANNKGGLYKTINRGSSWTKILDKARVESCTINGNEMYVSTEYEGLWYSKDANSPIPSFSLVQSYPFKHPMRIYVQGANSDVYVTSFGYGIVKGTKQGPALPTKAIQISPPDKAIDVDLKPQFSWNDLGSGVDYFLSIYKGSTNTLFNSYLCFNTTFSGQQLESNTKYFWTIQGDNSSGKGPVSDTLSFTTKDNSKDVNDNYVTAVSIFPNPASDYLNIKSKEDFSLSIFDEFAEKIMEISNQTKIDISHLSKGIYFCKLRKMNQTENIRLIILK
ncbi:MAG: T9SS type A sorting domain-containing protein [Candidatus Kapabacteria bacterium]|nr:T9SS type A sorting domain-containing protein [Candidatus Kapabacteria bacterium]